MERYITEENMEAVVNYVTDKANLYLTEQFEKEMALWELEATWHKVLENYPKEAKALEKLLILGLGNYWGSIR